MRGELFGTQSLPLPERIVGYAYPAVLLLLCLAGMFVLLRRWQALAPGPLLVALLILGPGLWMVSVLAMVGGSIGGRLPSMALPLPRRGALRGVSASVSSTACTTVPRSVRRAAVVGIVGARDGGRRSWSATTSAGGSRGRHPPAQRVPSPSPTPPIAAARWLLRTTGRDHAVVGDRGSELVFGTFGEQQPLSATTPVPFVAKTPARMARELERLGASYVVIDRRISLLPPRFGYYFGPEELAASNRSLYGQPFPLAQLDKLDRVRTLSLMYDNGTTAVYGPAALALEPRGSPDRSGLASS